MEKLETENVVETQETDVKEVEGKKTFTQEEVDKLLQSETDKRVTSAINTAKSKWEAEYTKKLESEKSEAEKLAKMSEEDRFKAELEKEKELFEAERQEFQKAKLDMMILKELSHAGLPTEFKDFVTADKAEEVSNNIKTLNELWGNAINKAVDERLKGRTPKTANTTVSTGVMSKKEFASLTTKERTALLTADPDLLKKLK